LQATWEPIHLVDADRQAIGQLGRGATSALRVHDLLQERPILTIQSASKALSMPFPTATAALERLREAGIVDETTGRLRGRIFAYTAYLGLLKQGTEPLQI
jgi:Fic family protein